MVDGYPIANHNENGILIAYQGFYKVRTKLNAKTFEPIAFYLVGERDIDGNLIEDEYLIATIRDYIISDYHIANIWNECSQHEISFDEYLDLVNEVV